MSPRSERILQEVLALPAEERRELIDALLVADPPGDDLPFDPAWLSEISRRSAELDAGTVEATPWPIVRERVRRRVEGRADD
ncbi:MAG: addiction module protein [Planctomycetaceae bacterium]